MAGRIVKKRIVLIFETDFRVLVIEDETLISFLIVDMLADIGCKCVDAATSVEGAMDALTKAEPDFAMLDVNLSGKRSDPIADILLAREIPFVFLSSYGSSGLDEAYAGAKILQKPFQLCDIETALADVFEFAHTGAPCSPRRPPRVKRLLPPPIAGCGGPTMKTRNQLTATGRAVRECQKAGI